MKNLNKAALLRFVTTGLEKLSRFKLVIFIVLVGLVYGYILLTISSLSSVQPSEDLVNSQSNPIAKGRINMQVINRLKQLEDNSTSVRALFDDARSNPFQE